MVNYFLRGFSSGQTKPMGRFGLHGAMLGERVRQFAAAAPT
jgi:hypothetical protein